ncbi:hypothetical protein Ae406Ps2_3815c [Pseudonocardia sp. Ae406_Ps2]|nr:hypothetical protein Ae406Ps2_3815c [Pseudonocardia sp. Ae406_Ps2]OLM11332.1 hypothetical protein Ae505Ps2_1456 [Pseudonocardia sp. Ae505_Ps2]OLM25372.1 hypothetical protein Ae706Ps2_3805c [Pseudonocardia sp. Ae706_Ps2]
MSDTVADHRHEPGDAAVPTPHQKLPPRHSPDRGTTRRCRACPPHGPKSMTGPWCEAPS